MNNSIKKEVIIKSGTFNLIIDYLNPAYDDIEDLITFASRENKKRGFFFVSKILGKHIPVKPSKMRQSYDLIAADVGHHDGNMVVVGMSEAAVGLGGGVADSLWRKDTDKKVIFHHTTRHELKGQEIWFNVNESHSHAKSHLIYKPAPILKMEMKSAKSLVLVDDEITTGKTLFQLACGYLTKLASVETLYLASLISWMTDEMELIFRQELKAYCDDANRDMPELIFVSLAKGSFEFTRNKAFSADLPAKTDIYLEDAKSISNLGRKGVLMPINVDDNGDDMVAQDLTQCEKVSVIGTGEHLFYPFLVAEKLEENGVNVFFQSTTRSPIIVDGAIKSKEVIRFSRKNGKEVNHFAYNLNTSASAYNLFSFESQEFSQRHKQLTHQFGV
jgi:hypothetical protein